MHASTRRSLATLVALASLVAAPLAAQQASTLAAPAEPAAPASATAPAGPTLEQATVGVHAPAATTRDASTASASRAGLGTAKAQMIVGFAGLVAGAIIGGTAGTLIMVGGAALGLWGLYNYLQ